MVRIRAIAACVAVVATSAVGAQKPDSFQSLGRDILKALIETNTTHSSGNVTLAAERMAARLLTAGFPKADVQVVGQAEKKRNLVARYRGKGARKPILVIAHLDVVEAKR